MSDVCSGGRSGLFFFAAGRLALRLRLGLILLDKPVGAFHDPLLGSAIHFFSVRLSAEEAKASPGTKKQIKQLRI